MAVETVVAAGVRVVAVDADVVAGAVLEAAVVVDVTVAVVVADGTRSLLLSFLRMRDRSRICGPFFLGWREKLFNAKAGKEGPRRSQRKADGENVNRRSRTIFFARDDSLL